MWCVFEYFNGSNPYITKNYGELFKMFCKYYYTQTGNTSFMVQGLREWNGNRKTYEGKKELLRAVAIEWQSDFSNRNYSYGELTEWQGFFEEYGRRFGLLAEFRENAIC